MIDKKTIEALKVQVESATQKIDGYYAGLYIATLAIIQAHKLPVVEARKVVDKIGLHVTIDDLEAWCRPVKPLLEGS